MKTLRGSCFIHKFDRNFSAKQTPTHISRHLDGKLIKLSVTKKNRIFMCEQDCENKKLVITKFSIFLQTQNSNFRLSANRAILSITLDNFLYFDFNNFVFSSLYMS